MTSSPGPMPSEVSATCSAAVPVATLMAYLLPCHSANCFSNSMPRLAGPVVHLARAQNRLDRLDGILVELGPALQFVGDGLGAAVDRQLIAHNRILSLFLLPPTRPNGFAAPETQFMHPIAPGCTPIVKAEVEAAKPRQRRRPAGRTSELSWEGRRAGEMPALFRAAQAVQSLNSPLGSNICSGRGDGAGSQSRALSAIWRIR